MHRIRGLVLLSEETLEANDSGTSAATRILTSPDLMVILRLEDPVLARLGRRSVGF